MPLWQRLLLLLLRVCSRSVGSSIFHTAVSRRSYVLSPVHTEREEWRCVNALEKSNKFDLEAPRRYAMLRHATHSVWTLTIFNISLI